MVTQHAAALPRNILFVPEVSLFPEAYPIATLQEPVTSPLAAARLPKKTLRDPSVRHLPA